MNALDAFTMGLDKRVQDRLFEEHPDLVASVPEFVQASLLLQVANGHGTNVNMLVASGILAGYLLGLESSRSLEDIPDAFKRVFDDD